MSPTAPLEAAPLARVLTARKPRLISPVMAPRRASVAAVLRDGDDGVEVLLMQRVHRASDRWSGQVSFPGGMADPQDRDALDTAIRETHEEVGLLLPRAAALGRSDDQIGIASGRKLPLAITPYIFHLPGPRPALELGPEAAAAFWLPLRPVISGELDCVHVWRKGPLRKELPCWRYAGYEIWGLTHRMMAHLIELAQRG